MSATGDEEDFLPEPTEEEMDEALSQKLSANASFRSLYHGSKGLARERLMISAVVDCLLGRRNLWPLRERRARIEEEMSEEDCAYLAKRHFYPPAREHYEELLVKKRSEKGLSDETFAILSESASEYDREFFVRTAARVSDVESPMIVSRRLARDAMCGSVVAQAGLGDAFLHGHEVERDVELAAFWLEKAAQGGDEPSARRLAELRGEGLA